MTTPKHDPRAARNAYALACRHGDEAAQRIARQHLTTVNILSDMERRLAAGPLLAEQIVQIQSMLETMNHAADPTWNADAWRADHQAGTVSGTGPDGELAYNWYCPCGAKGSPNRSEAKVTQALDNHLRSAQRRANRNQ